MFFSVVVVSFVEMYHVQRSLFDSNTHRDVFCGSDLRRSGFEETTIVLNEKIENAIVL
jgi:hypothetical protein